MDPCTLPIELCEYIIDVLDDSPLQSEHGNRRDQSGLRACALTCRAWRVRAQHLLWRSPHLRQPSQVSRFIACIENGPSCFISLPIAISLGRRYHSDPSRAHWQLPPALLTFAFPSLRTLSCNSVQFGLHRRILRMRLPFFVSITMLRLEYCSFDSARALYDVVWAFPDLSSLEIQHCSVLKPPTVLECARLSTICGNLRACRGLSRLFFDCVASLPDTPASLIGSAFGSSLTVLYIAIERAETLSALLANSFPVLQSLTVMSTATLDEKSKADSLCWMRAISGSFAVPGTLQTIRLSRKHGLDGHACCQDLVGKQEDEDGSLPLLRGLLSGVSQLVFYLYKCDVPEKCAEYVCSVLPSMGDVIRFKRQGFHDTWIEYPVPCG